MGRSRRHRVHCWFFSFEICPLVRSHYSPRASTLPAHNSCYFQLRPDSCRKCRRPLNWMDFKWISSQTRLVLPAFPAVLLVPCRIFRSIRKSKRVYSRDRTRIIKVAVTRFSPPVKGIFRPCVVASAVSKSNKSIRILHPLIPELDTLQGRLFTCRPQFFSN